MKNYSVSVVTANGLIDVDAIRDANIEVSEVVPADVEAGRTCNNVTGVVTVCGVEISVRLSQSLLANVNPDEAEYLVNSVKELGSFNVLWSFREEAEVFSGIARLYYIEDGEGWVIALHGRLTNQGTRANGIVKVIPLDSLLCNEYTIRDLTRLKVRLAKTLRTRYVLNDEEWLDHQNYRKKNDDKMVFSYIAGSAVLLVKGRQRQFTLFSPELIRQIKKGRIRLGMKTTIAIYDRNSDGDYPLYRVTRKEGVRLIGYYPPIA